MMGMRDTPISPERKHYDLERSGTGGREGIININDGGHTRSLHTHTPRVIKSQRQYAPRGQGMSTRTIGATKSRGKKVYPGKIFEALIWEWGKCAAKSIFLAMAFKGTNRCKESKLSLADTASLLLGFGTVLYTLSLLSRCETLGLKSVSPHPAVSVCLD